jgi:hypothetical protein
MLPQKNAALERRLLVLAENLDRVMNSWTKRRIKDNLTMHQRQGLNALKSKCCAKSIRVSKSDKGGDFVVINTELDKKITLQHLSDTTTYQVSSRRSFDTIESAINKAWVNICSVHNFPKKLKDRLVSTHSIPPCLYTLIKTHKLNSDDLHSEDPSLFKVRPIISSCNDPADKISYFLSFILSLQQTNTQSIAPLRPRFPHP